jgi:hypothetical protein
MATITDFATPAAAVTAGYAKTQVDRGAAPATPNFNGSQPLRYQTKFEKPVTGSNFDSGFRLEAFGESAASAAAADTQALNALNALRRHRYGGAPGRASGDGDSPTVEGGTMTADVS